MSPSRSVCNHVFRLPKLPILYSHSNFRALAAADRAYVLATTNCKSVSKSSSVDKMYSPLRILFFALNAFGWTLLVFLGTSSIVLEVSALPVARPMIHSADYAPAQNTSAPFPVEHVSPGTPSTKRDILDTIEGLPGAGSSFTPRDINTMLGDINILNNYYNQMAEHASNFRQCEMSSPCFD